MHAKDLGVASNVAQLYPLNFLDAFNCNYLGKIKAPVPDVSRSVVAIVGSFATSAELTLIEIIAINVSSAKYHNDLFLS